MISLKSKFIRQVSVFLAVAICFLSTSCHAVRVGIYGCLHGDLKMNTQVLSSMKEHGVTEIIANGDFIGPSNMAATESILHAISEMLGPDRTKERLHIMPGNWDETAGQGLVSSALIDKYGTLIASDYGKSGLVNIGGKKILVAHFPQHPIPSQYLPPKEYLFRYLPGQHHIISTMAQKMRIPEDVALNVYGHTHLRADFYSNDGKLTINSGGLTSRKLPAEKRSYAIYDTETNQVEFYSMESEPPELLKIVSAVAPSGAAYDLQNMKISQLPEVEMDKFIKEYRGDPSRPLHSLDLLAASGASAFCLSYFAEPSAAALAAEIAFISAQVDGKD